MNYKKLLETLQNLKNEENELAEESTELTITNCLEITKRLEKKLIEFYDGVELNDVEKVYEFIYFYNNKLYTRTPNGYYPINDYVYSDKYLYTTLKTLQETERKIDEILKGRLESLVNQINKQIERNNDIKRQINELSNDLNITKTTIENVKWFNAELVNGKLEITYSTK